MSFGASLVFQDGDAQIVRERRSVLCYAVENDVYAKRTTEG
eukprot:COSAG05_NODE_39_length_27555_cov_750.282925_20_plen_41_part_00